MADLEEKVRNSLELSSDNAQSRILDAVSEELLAADPSLTVERTGYFNHSFIPDLVAVWPTGSRRKDGEVERSARPYFLRLELDSQQVELDIARLGEDAPGIVGLLSTEASEAVTYSEVIATSPTTLVCQGSAIERVAKARTDDAFASMVPPAVVRAGRGYLGHREAAELTHAASTGFDAAVAADEGATREALYSIRAHIAGTEAAELERTLGVVWLGGGGSREDFPAGIDLDSSPLPGTLARTLRMLFSQPEIDRPEFWERVAGWVSESDLLSLGDVDPCLNLDHLMWSASSRLKFMSAALTNPVQDRSPNDPAWSLKNEGLLFSSSGPTLHFVTDGRAHSHWPEERDLPRWEVLKERLTDFIVEQAQFDSATVKVQVDAQPDAGVTQVEVRQSIQEMSGLGAVRAIVVSAPGTRSVRCRLGPGVTTAVRSKPVAACHLGWAAAAITLGLDPGWVDEVYQGLFGGSGEFAPGYTDSFEELS